MGIETKTLDFLEEYNLLEPGSIWIVGFSCGYDSLCLLHVLKKIAKQYSIRLIAAHLNHNWRGEESFSEQERAREFCKKNDIEFYTETLTDEIPKTETVAREYRYWFFKKAAEQYNAKVLFTAHTQTDNAETILYRIIKGTGVKGLSGIAPKRDMGSFCVYRPMLEVEREDTIFYCLGNVLDACNDSSNYDKKYMRNKIRIDIISQLKKINKNVETALAQLGKIAEDYEDIVADAAPDFNFETGASTKDFINLKDGMQRVIIRKFLTEKSIEYDYEKINIILDKIKENSSIKAGKKFSIADGMWLFVSSEHIKFLSACQDFFVDEDLEIYENQETYIQFLNKTIKISKFEGDSVSSYPKETENTVLANMSKLHFPLVLRTRNPGDIIQPFGMEGKMKLKKYFINKAIPRYKRDTIPLLAYGDEVLWVIGVGISEKLRVENKPTHIIEIK